MGERIFFSKLRKVLASWLLCIKFENARLVIFQIGYGPSHLISMLAVSLSPLAPSFCWQERSTPAGTACAGRAVGRDLQPPLFSLSPLFPYCTTSRGDQAIPVHDGRWAACKTSPYTISKWSNSQINTNISRLGAGIWTPRPAGTLTRPFVYKWTPSPRGVLGNSHFTHSNETLNHSQQQGL